LGAGPRAHFAGDFALSVASLIDNCKYYMWESTNINLTERGREVGYTSYKIDFEVETHNVTSKDVNSFRWRLSAPAAPHAPMNGYDAVTEVHFQNMWWIVEVIWRR
jgi:hypothetical protein